MHIYDCVKEGLGDSSVPRKFERIWITKDESVGDRDIDDQYLEVASGRRRFPRGNLYIAAEEGL